MKIRVTGSSSYEKEQDGIVVESRIYSPPPVETPEGKVWNGVLGKFLDESEANYPFEVDENDTVFGEGHLAEWSAGDELAASLEEEDEDLDDEGEKEGEKKQKKGKTEKKKVDEKPTKTAQDSLYEALVADELPKDKTLAEHDKERHPDGFNPETDSCKFRDELKKETETDKGDEVDVNRGREEGIETAKKEEQDSTGDAHKKKQLDIILDTNPMTDDYHTGIRELSDIKTFAEACEDDPPANPDITEELVEDANNSGKIVVYSSYPIRNGTFVTPSRMMAKDYAGSGQVYSKEVPLEDVAWISGDEGQYAKVAESEKRETDSGSSNQPLVTQEEDKEYMEAVERDDMETASRMLREVAARAFPNTKVVDEDGLPQIQYHYGRLGIDHYLNYDDDNDPFIPNGLTHFGTRQAAADREVATSGAFDADEENSYGTTSYFLNIENPMDTQDGWGRANDKKNGANIEHEGYDGNKYENVIEGKGSVSWVAYKPSQIKSADPVTWDDKGHVVPLSKRFDSGDDIRGDVSGGKKDDSARLDEEYMSAIDDDDTEKAKRVLRDAAAIAMPDTRVVDEDGKPKIVWHGTGAEFTQFKEKEVAPKTRFIMDIGIHFGDEELAKKYARVPVDGRDGLGSGDRGTGSKMMPCFLDLKNPIDLRYRSKIDDAFANRMREIAGIGTRSKAWILKDVEPNELVQKAIEKDARAVRKAFDDFGYDGAVYEIANMAGAEAWMAFKPSQIKSAEIVTTGDDGEVIPVSRRFDGGNDIRGDVSGGTSSSVRHSISDDGEEFGDSFYGEVYPDRKQSYSSEFGKDDAEDGEKASEAYRENFTKDGKYKSPFEGGKFNRAFLERAREGKGAETGEVWDDESRAAAEAAGRVLSGMLGGVTFELSDKPYKNSENSMTMKSRTIEITPEEEEEYSEAVEDHDDDWANDIVKNVAKKWGALVDDEGNPIKLYHGSDSGGIICASDRINLFTTVSPRTAKVFGKGRSDSSVQCFYGRMENPLTIDAKRENWDGINVPKELSSYIEEEYATTDELADGARKAGFDGLIIKNIHEGSLEVTDDYVFLNAEGNVKLADPITFDYYGNVIPISERFNGYNSEVRYFRNNSGKVVGEYNRATNKITLYPGAKIKDVVHEYSHGLWQFAEQEAKAGRDGLQKKLHQIAHAAPEKVKEAVGRSYYDQDPNVVLEECFTHEMARRSEKNKAFADAIKTASGKKWYKKAWGAIKDTWKGLASKLGFNKADTSRIDDMTSGEAADFILTQMAQGKKFGDVNPDDTPDGGGKGETRKSIVGEQGASNLKLGHLDEAKKMAEEGADKNEILQKTGWWKAKDGLWRIEIPDLKITKKKMNQINSYLNEWDIGGSGILDISLGELIKGSKVLKAYPEFNNLVIKLVGKGPTQMLKPKCGGFCDMPHNNITIYDCGTDAGDWEYTISVLEHELQHAIQSKEGFARGGAPGYEELSKYSNSEYDDYTKTLESSREDVFAKLEEDGLDYREWVNNLDDDKYAELRDEEESSGKLVMARKFLEEIGNDKYEDKLLRPLEEKLKESRGKTTADMTGQQIYHNLLGEVEARNAALRHGLDMEDRRDTMPPWDTEDVPEEKQIVRH